MQPYLRTSTGSEKIIDLMSASSGRPGPSGSSTNRVPKMVLVWDVHVAGGGVVLGGLDVGDVGEVFVLAGSDYPGLAELGGLLGGFLGEIAGDQIVGLAGDHKIQRHHGELLGGAALEKADLVVVRHVQHPADGCLGVLDDLV